MASKETAAAREKLNQDFRTIVSDAQELLNATKGDLDEKAQQARTRLEERLENLRGKYDELGDTVRGKAEATDQMIREYPYHTLGLTFGIGLVLGMLMRRK